MFHSMNKTVVHRVRPAAHFSILIIVALTTMALTACAPAPEGQATIILTTATSAEPIPALPDSVRNSLISLGHHAKRPGDATVQLITSTKEHVPARDLTPLRSNGQVQHAPADANRQITAAVSDVAEQVTATTAPVPGLDLLSLLDRASTFPGSRIDVLSSGVSTENPIDFRQLGWDVNPDAVVDSVQRQGLLPDLGNHHVTFYGLGVAAGSQPALPPFARRKIQQLWIALCTRANAASCDIGHDASSTAAPVATLPVPVVPVPSAYSEGGCPVWQTLSDEALRFSPDSDVLGDVDSVLRPVVEAVQRCDLVVDLAGHIADVGGGVGDPKNLSGRRAHAVANRLLSLGLSPQQLGDVVGRGASEPVVPNLTADGHFIESAAQQNRRVELTFHRVGDR